MSPGSVLVLGALSDIGVEIAYKFASIGYNIQLAARKLNELKFHSDGIKKKYDVDVKCFEFDALKTETHLDFIKNLDLLPEILICSVGIMIDQKSSQKIPNERLKIIRTNFEGPMNILSEFANFFEKRGSGTIVGISSVAGERGRASNYIYGSAKAGFTTFLSGLRNRLSKKNIHVVTVLPGTVYTKMTKNLNLPKILTTIPSKVSEDIYQAIKKKRNIIHTIKIWAIIMLLIKVIPEEIFKKLNI